MIYEVDDGKLVEVRGNREHPMTRGGLCVKLKDFHDHHANPDRLKYPLRRTGPKGSKQFERISWEEALDLVSSEIKRVKTEHGQGAIMANHGSHHTWGNIGYYISTAYKFFNAIGYTRVIHNPDSWEGWYWGAMHHFGYSMRLGQTETYSLVEDLMKEAEMVVFWSADPEATSGSYSAFEGTPRRQWLKELGIEIVHIDPYYNHTAALLGGKWFAPRPGTDAALARSFGSCCHGAGRAMSRHGARLAQSGQEVRRALEERGIVVTGAGNKELAEEAPHAYKDVDRVVEVVHAAGLAIPVARLVPAGVLKG